MERADGGSWPEQRDEPVAAAVSCCEYVHPAVPADHAVPQLPAEYQQQHGVRRRRKLGGDARAGDMQLGAPCADAFMARLRRRQLGVGRGGGGGAPRDPLPALVGGAIGGGGMGLLGLALMRG